MKLTPVTEHPAVRDAVAVRVRLLNQEADLKKAAAAIEDRLNSLTDHRPDPVVRALRLVDATTEPSAQDLRRELSQVQHNLQLVQDALREQDERIRQAKSKASYSAIRDCMPEYQAVLAKIRTAADALIAANAKEAEFRQKLEALGYNTDNMPRIRVGGEEFAERAAAFLQDLQEHYISCGLVERKVA